VQRTFHEIRIAPINPPNLLIEVFCQIQKVVDCIIVVAVVEPMVSVFHIFIQKLKFVVDCDRWELDLRIISNVVRQNYFRVHVSVENIARYNPTACYDHYQDDCPNQPKN
jgi:hypothetical protein